ncbi:type III polyketide synthase [candidate division GN15 bacterium]|nr:type III polyketide synthase [candidate division GN15 bacterium]
MNDLPYSLLYQMHEQRYPIACGGGPQQPSTTDTMSKITAVTTAVPPYVVEQSQARDFAAHLFKNRVTDIERLLPLFDNTGIKRRYFSRPIEWFEIDHSLQEKNNAYIEAATDLGAEACRLLFERAGITPDQIDYIVYINTTGLATPSIDARLINVLGLRTDIRRTPIWGLGCAGGAAALSHAHHYCLGHPDHRVLIVAVELCGLTFMPDDFSKSNLVATALFGEGASAVLVTGDQVAGDGLTVRATQSNFYADSLNVMGWNVQSRGLQVVFDKRIPDLIADNSAAELDVFLKQERLERDDIDQFLYHPGGMKVLEAYVAAYGVPDNHFRFSREILADYGNMSSVTVLFVLERYMREVGLKRDRYGVISALGPGFCSESLLVKL